MLDSMRPISMAGLPSSGAAGVGAAALPYVPRVALFPHTRWEVEAVAVSLPTTGILADPYALPAGPTAHMPPAYAFFRSLEAMLPWLAARLGAGARAGVVGGLAGAVIPRWPSQIDAPAAVLMGLLLVAFLRRWGRDHRARERDTVHPRGRRDLALDGAPRRRSGACGIDRIEILDRLVDRWSDAKRRPS
jgi:hypothetical protein